MIIEASLILAVISALLELYLVSKVKWLRDMIERWLILGLLMSFLMSVLLGVVFGANGLIVMIAGVLSTVFTQTVYWLWSKVHAISRKFALRKDITGEASVH